MSAIESLKPHAELYSAKPHGTRLRYMSGCKCVPCKAANSTYEVGRAKARKNGEWNGIVPADRARRHIAHLSKVGIGYKTVADIAGMAHSTVFKIQSGRRKNLRKQNESAILSIDETALPDSALVDARPTWKKINWLLEGGFTKKSLARALGYKAPAIQFRKSKIRAKTALKIEQFYNRIRVGE
ncbi:MAG: hypothetical protein KIS76_04035 [Pyrinomonadaceae bacterium]|nr:hypothetical protein [Pyrinomonadaceae bacterium]